MNLTAALNTSVGRVRQAISSLLSPATLIKTTAKTYDVLTGRKNSIVTQTTINVVVEAFDVSELNSSVLYSDLKITIFKDPSFEITLDDKIMIGGVTYSIVKITPAYVGGDVLTYTIQLR